MQVFQHFHQSTRHRAGKSVSMFAVLPKDGANPKRQVSPVTMGPVANEALTTGAPLHVMVNICPCVPAHVLRSMWAARSFRGPARIGWLLTVAIGSVACVTGHAPSSGLIWLGGIGIISAGVTYLLRGFIS